MPDSSKRHVSFVTTVVPGPPLLYPHGIGSETYVLTDDGHGRPAPYSVIENGDSFLDATIWCLWMPFDRLHRPVPVRMRPVLRRRAGCNDLFRFHYQYLTRNQRWASPKFLIGESYGDDAIRANVVVLQQRHQIYLNGIVLLSSVGFGNWGTDDRQSFF